MNALKPSAHPLGWMKSVFWLAFAVGCFHLAYASIHFPAAGLLILGYAFALVQLADQLTVRRAFYFGLAAGYLGCAPQLSFFWRIFGPAAIVLWFVVAFWIGLFTAMVCGGARRWGKARAVWLVPVIWTGLEYFRSELYYLKFSWLNIGYALAPWWNDSGAPHQIVGMYGVGFCVFGIIAAGGRGLIYSRGRKLTLAGLLLFILGLAIAAALFLPVVNHRRGTTPLCIAGIQTEFPSPGVLPRVLDRALAKAPDAQVFVLSEYTLDGRVPDTLKDWCRRHARYLIVGGKDPVGTNNYYNTTFVVGTNGDIVFQQVKSVPIQFFIDGLPAPRQEVWDSPWGKIGICICYDLSYTRVTDRLVRQGAQLLIVPTMDVEYWGRHEHELHSRVAPVRAAEYGLPIFRLASSGISQAVTGNGRVIAQTSYPGSLDILSVCLPLPPRGALPLDRVLAPICTGLTAIVLAVLLILNWRDERARRKG